ncbi:MAG: hypothetical protein WAW24_09820 [Bacteroidales bacterium]
MPESGTDLPNCGTDLRYRQELPEHKSSRNYIILSRIIFKVLHCGKQENTPFYQHLRIIPVELIKNAQVINIDNLAALAVKIELISKLS